MREPLLWLLVFSLAKILFFFANPLVAIDDMRQFGPALAATAGGDAYLLEQPQIAYYAAVMPDVYRQLMGAVWSVTGISLVASMKMVAVLTFMVTVVAIVGVSRELFESRLTRSLASFFLVANLLMTAQVLSGTPRDFGSALLVWSIYCWVKQWWVPLGGSLFLLAGFYPLYGLLLLAAVAIWSLGLSAGGCASGRGAVLPRRIGSVLILAGLAIAGLHLLGPAAGHQLGPVLEIFRADGGPPIDGYPLDGRRFLQRILEAGNFQFIIHPDRAPLMWGKFVLLGLLGVGVSAAGDQADRWAWSSIWSRRWAPVVLSLVAASLVLYGVSLFLAFRLHAPSRYTNFLWLVVFAGLETAIAVRVWRYPYRRCTAVLVSILLCYLALPVGAYQLPAEVVHQLRQLGLDRSDVQVLAVEGRKDKTLRSLNDSLPLFLGWRSYYLAELDRSYHLNTLRMNQRLLRSYEELVRGRDVVDFGSDPPLRARLKALGITHLLLGGRPSASMPESLRNCAYRITMTGERKSLHLVPTECLAADRP